MMLAMSPTARPRRVQLFVTCLVDAFYPETAHAARRVLERLGLEVAIPPGQTCCGQPAFNAGHRDEARRVAAHFVDTFAPDPAPVVAPSGSCVDMVVHQFPALLTNDPARAAAARDLAARTYELSQFIVDVLGDDEAAVPVEPSLTYHACCHGLRGLGLDRQPRALVGQAGGANVRPLDEDDRCCGFGGLFAVKMGPISSAMLDRKLEAIERSGADVVVVTDASCRLHMEGGLRRRASRTRVAHIADVLDDRV